MKENICKPYTGKRLIYEIYIKTNTTQKKKMWVKQWAEVGVANMTK